MTEEFQKLKDILRSNIKAIKDVADNLFYVKDKLDATQETVADLIVRVEELESKGSISSVGGVMAFNAAGSTVSTSTPLTLQALDLEEEALPELIMQHPSWLRPFTVLAELEKHELEEDIYRLIRSQSGYLRVIRLVNGMEWAYFEEMTKERFLRIPLLSEIFSDIEHTKELEWGTAWTVKPIRLQALQRGARWEILDIGQYVSATIQ